MNTLPGLAWAMFLTILLLWLGKFHNKRLKTKVKPNIFIDRYYLPTLGNKEIHKYSGDIGAFYITDIKDNLIYGIYKGINGTSDPINPYVFTYDEFNRLMFPFPYILKDGKLSLDNNYSKHNER